MRKTRMILHRLMMCVLVAIPVVVTLGTLMTGVWQRPAWWVLSVTVLSLLAVHLPGRKQIGNRTIPVRGLIVFPLAAALLAVFIFTRWPYAGEIGLLYRICCGLLVAMLFLMEVRECSAKAPIFEGSRALGIGVVMYLAAGTAIWALKLWEMNALLYGCAAVFLVVGAFSLNSESLDTAYAAHRTVKPAASVLRANRWMLVLLVLIVAFVAMFDRIREWASGVMLVVVRAVMRAVVWFMSLFSFEQTSTGGVENAQMDGMFPMEEAPEPHIIWQILYYVALGVALIVLAFLLYKAARIVARKLKVLIDRIVAYFRRFAESISEEYTDERASLFDAGELRRSMEDSIRDAIRRITHREKRWEQMDAREKVRFIVRSLYRKTGDLAERLRPMTVHEAMNQLNTGSADPGTVADLYDRARYSEETIPEGEAEALKKAMKP